jgi:hypothetical protein
MEISGGLELQLHVFLKLAVVIKDNFGRRKKAMIFPHMYSIRL